MLKRNLFFLFSLTIFASVSLVLDLFNYNPYQANNYIFANFFISLFLSLAGMISIFIYLTKFSLFKNKSIYRSFFPSIRQGILISLALTTLLFLKTLKLLDWWVTGPLMIAIILLELFFQTSSPINKIKKQEKLASH